MSSAIGVRLERCRPPPAELPARDDAVTSQTETVTETGADTSGFRLLHTMIRVKDQDRSIDFYTRHLCMKVIRQKDYDGGRFTNTFIGYGDEDTDTVLELTYNWDQAELYTHGSGFGHLAVAVPDIYATCNALRAEGVKITREPGPMKHGTTVIAFIEDPDGYKIELIERS
jgi:lactoylglutathione lyase